MTRPTLCAACGEPVSPSEDHRDATGAEIHSACCFECGRRGLDIEYGATRWDCGCVWHYSGPLKRKTGRRERLEECSAPVCARLEPERYEERLRAEYPELLGGR